MSRFVSRPFDGKEDLVLLIDFARQATIARDPQPAYWHPGDVVWQLYQYTDRGPLEDVRLWFDGKRLAAFALFEDSLVAHFEVGAGHEGATLAAEILAWAEARRRTLGEHATLPRAYEALGRDTLSTNALDSDQARIAQVRSLGFEPVDHFGYRFRRSLLDPITVPGLSAGMRLRHATDADIDERVDLHRDAWSVWGASSFNAVAYRKLRAAPLYDERLDVVLEGSGGRLLSSCICWADEASGAGALEPVGTRPGAAGQGLGKATIMEGLRRLRGRGMHSAIVGTASVNAGGRRLYLACGFEEIDRDHFYAKRVV